MYDRKVLKLVVSSLLASMVCVATMLIKIPIPATGGYVHPGDGIVLICGLVLGPVYGGVAAGLGSALADLLSGYAIYVPATLIIKAACAMTVGVIVRSGAQARTLRVILAGAAAMAVTVLGYFVYEGVFLGYGWAAAAALLPNALQGLFGIALALLLLPAVKRVPVHTLRDKKESAHRRDGDTI